MGAGDRGLSGSQGLAEADVDELEAAVEGAADDDQDDRGHDAENGYQPGVRGRSIRVEASFPSHGSIQSAGARWRANHSAAGRPKAKHSCGRSGRFIPAIMARGARRVK